MLIAVIGLTFFCIILLINTIILRKKVQQNIEINTFNQQENLRLEQSVYAKRSELQNIEISINSQNNILKSLITTSDELQRTATEKAEEAYREKEKALQADYDNREKTLKQQLAILFNSAESKLKDLEDKQRAYIEANKRQIEIANKQDYYRLNLDSVDLDDIQLLRELQPRFSQKESIDKLIWEVYYKPAYDILMSHLFTSSNKFSGIYRITDNITNLSYIGQSVDIKERFRQHIKSALSYGKSTNKLYQMMQKSGVHNFTFEILELIPKDKLNERENYWIEFYKTKEYGLNSQKGKLT